MSKQDRVYTRTASDLERKYNFGQRFAEILGIATDAQDAALKAAEAIKQFDESLTPEQIFLLLTGGGADQGVYRENGKIYLNANYIKTGFISSDLIKAGVIRSLDYEQIAVDEYYPSESLYPDVSLYPNDGKDITKGMEIDFGAGVIRGKYYEAGQPYNFLDNSDFTNPVNQRGLTSYTGSQYTIDRWRTFADSESVTIQNGYISKVGNLLQYVSGLDSSKVYTAAVCLYDGTIATYSNVLSSNIGSWLSLIYAQYNASTGLLAFRLTANARDVKWVALYEGEYTVETLPKYQPKGYGAELAECMRYYWHLKDLFRIRCNQVTTSVMDFLIVLPVPMRIKPTLVPYSEAKVYSQANNTANSGFALTIQCTEGAVQRGHMTIRATKSAHGLTDGWLELPANSYFTADF